MYSSPSATFQRRLTAPRLIGLAFTLFGLAACDSLWSRFAIDDPNSCAAANSNNPCTNQQTCNRSTGICEPNTLPPPNDPLTITKISPVSLPSEGGTIEILGGGLSANTTISIDTGVVTNLQSVPDRSKLIGTVPKAQKLCVPLDISIQRGNEQPLIVPSVFRYRFEPFTLQSQFSVGTIAGLKVSQLITAQMDNDGRLDLMVGHSNGFRLIYGPDGTAGNNSIAGQRTGSSDKFRVGKFTGSGNSDVISIQGATLYVESCSPALGGICNSKSTYTSQSTIRDAFVADVFSDPGNELIVVSSDATGKGTVSILKYNPVTIGTVAPSYTSSEDIVAASVGDRDLDGNDDTLFLSSAAKLYMLPFPPPGTATWISQILTNYGGGIGAPVLGRLDGDAIADLVVFSASSGKLLVANGKNNFTNLTSYAIPNVSAGSLAATALELQLADVNCDGASDIIVSTRDAGFGPYFFLNDGQGNYGSVATTPSGGGIPLSPGGPISVFDVDGDKVPDLFMRPPGASAQGLLFGRGKLP